jgi:hypothetical protein
MSFVNEAGPYNALQTDASSRHDPCTKARVAPARRAAELNRLGAET